MTTKTFLLYLWLSCVWAAGLWLLVHFMWRWTYPRADEDRERYERVEETVSEGRQSVNQ